MPKRIQKVEYENDKLQPENGKKRGRQEERTWCSVSKSK